MQTVHSAPAEVLPPNACHKTGAPDTTVIYSYQEKTLFNKTFINIHFAVVNVASNMSDVLKHSFVDTGHLHYCLAFMANMHALLMLHLSLIHSRVLGHGFLVLYYI